MTGFARWLRQKRIGAWRKRARRYDARSRQNAYLALYCEQQASELEKSLIHSARS